MQYVKYIESPLGRLMVTANNNMLTGVLHNNQKYETYFNNHPYYEKDIPFFYSVEKWFDIYFSGKEPDFAIPVFFNGTYFQNMVWNILMTIPYGKSVSYGYISSVISFKTHAKMSPQAVGGAVKRNPVSIIIPCHRVTASNGYISGYAGGIEKKRILLELEHIRYKI